MAPCAGELGHESRLAHPGLALDDDRSAALLRHDVEQRAQARPLALAADEQSDRRSPRLESGIADESGDPDRPGLTAQQLRPAILDLEPFAGRPQRRLVEEDLAGLGDGLDSRRSRDRGTCQRPLAGVIAARRGDHFARRKADPDLQWLLRA